MQIACPEEDCPRNFNSLGEMAKHLRRSRHIRKFDSWDVTNTPENIETYLFQNRSCLEKEIPIDPVLLQNII